MSRNCAKKLRQKMNKKLRIAKTDDCPAGTTVCPIGPIDDQSISVEVGTIGRIPTSTSTNGTLATEADYYPAGPNFFGAAYAGAGLGRNIFGAAYAGAGLGRNIFGAAYAGAGLGRNIFGAAYAAAGLGRNIFALRSLCPNGRLPQRH